MKEIQFPLYVKKILTALADEGFASYLVGGAVRDFALAKKPKDYDVATNALPQEVCEIMQKNDIKIVENLGHNFGVVLAVVDGKPVEIGTFRSDRYGADAHRPENVIFCQTIEEDLARRDFTVNAMAVSIQGEFLDPYRGRDDLQAKVLRTVGEARKRFAEDGLRMFRACRFCAQLGFMPEPELIAAIMDEIERAKGLSLERVKTELEKILLAENVDLGLLLLVKSGLAGQSVSLRVDGKTELIPILPELKNLFDVAQEKVSDSYETWQRMLCGLVFCKDELQVRWSVLLYSIAKEYDATDEKKTYSLERKAAFAAVLARSVLQRFQYNEKFILQVEWLLANHTNFLVLMRSEEKSIKAWLRKEARSKKFHSSADFYKAFAMLNEVCFADIAVERADEENLVFFRSLGNKLVAFAAAMPVHTSDLAIKGKDIQQILHEEKIGKFLQDALHKVQEGILVNKKDALFEYLEQWQQ